MKPENIFYGRKLAIATKHKKEIAIAPVLEEKFGVKCFVAYKVDTDTLGTFTGEIERHDDPFATARNKCLLAMNLHNCDLAVASEGSFGPHPQLVFLPCDDELLVLVDRKNNLEIAVREVSTETNFGAKIISTEKELLEFAEASNFPLHGIILKQAKENYSGMVKGITDKNFLLEIFRKLKKENAAVYAETDMRAMYNPTRMKVIEKAAVKLAEKMQTECPQCKTPGFGITSVKSGLPCAWCASETRSTLSHVYQCAQCNYSEEKLFPNGKQTEDPMYCDRCNP